MGGIVNPKHSVEALAEEIETRSRALSEGDESRLIFNPPHYVHGRIQPIEVIEDWNLGPHLANVIKYLARCDHKGSPLEDLAKARWYLDREVWRRTRDDG